MARAPRIASFGFHEVTDDPAASGFQRPAARPFKHTRAAFAELLDQIAARRVSPVRVTDIDLARPGRHVMLTFDDGGKSAVHISDELSRRGWYGHFFVVTGLIGTRGFLDADEIRYIRSRGHVVGTHSHTHPDIFRDLPAARMAEEWRLSRDILAGILGEPCAAGSVPGGDISPLALRAAAAAGLRWLFTSEPWVTPRAVDGCWVLGRFGTKAGTAPAVVGALTEFRGWGRALAVRRLKNLARRGLPALYRLYVRRTTRPGDAL
jgi:peptidoglycan/xylan/chitin deacetylase (PgdA/CDA1 family)